MITVSHKARNAALLATLVVLALFAVLWMTPGEQPQTVPNAVSGTGLTQDQVTQLLRRSGHLCAEVVQVKRRIQSDVYDVRCYDYHGSYITADYSLNGVTGAVLRQ